MRNMRVWKGLPSLQSEAVNLANSVANWRYLHGEVKLNLRTFLLNASTYCNWSSWTTPVKLNIWIEEIKVPMEKILAFSADVDLLSNNPCVSMTTMAIFSPLVGTVCRKTSLHIMMPVVSRLLPERHEKPLRGSFSSPIQLLELSSGLLGKFIDLYYQKIELYWI